MQEILSSSAQLAAIDSTVWLSLLAIAACPLMCGVMLLFGWCSGRGGGCCEGGSKKKCHTDSESPTPVTAGKA